MNVTCGKTLTLKQREEDGRIHYLVCRADGTIVAMGSDGDIVSYDLDAMLKAAKVWAEAQKQMQEG